MNDGESMSDKMSDDNNTDPRQYVPNLVLLLEKKGEVTFSDARPEQRYAEPGETYDVRVNGQMVGTLHISGNGNLLYYDGIVFVDVPEMVRAKRGFCDPNKNAIMLLAQKADGTYRRLETRDWINFP